MFLFLLAPLRADAEHVRIATYNVRNYLEMGRRVGGYWKDEYPKPEAELQAVREVIRFADPDILALQEIGSAAHLAELQDDLAAEGLNFPYAYFGEQPGEPRRLAVLSKVEPESVTFHRQLDFAYFGGRERVKRGLLELAFETGGTEWRLFVVHLKSRYTARKDDLNGELRREREARAIRDFLRETWPPETAPLHLVVGDFNDHRDSGPVARFLEVSDTPLGKLVPTFDSRGEAWTFHYGRRDIYERVDFIVASPALWSRIPHRRGAIADPVPASLRGSDHRLVWVDVNFRE
ncbi:MAG: endonuclease/exonuclease/phosphatase family protein [Opitutales bacterium]